MGIGLFRREVQRWLNGYLLSAQRDAVSESRMPTDVDPEGIIDQRVVDAVEDAVEESLSCLLYTSPSPRDKRQSRMPSSA